jgi:hypothetical protein
MSDIRMRSNWSAMGVRNEFVFIGRIVRMFKCRRTLLLPKRLTSTGKLAALMTPPTCYGSAQQSDASRGGASLRACGAARPLIILLPMRLCPTPLQSVALAAFFNPSSNCVL